MAEPRTPDDRESLQGIAVARLVSGVLDGTYRDLENAQIALERSRRILFARRSNSRLQLAERGDSKPSH